MEFCHEDFVATRISTSIAPTVMKFGQSMGGGDSEVDLEGQVHRSRSRGKKM